MRCGGYDESEMPSVRSGMCNSLDKVVPVYALLRPVLPSGKATGGAKGFASLGHRVFDHCSCIQSLSIGCLGRDTTCH